MKFARRDARLDLGGYMHTFILSYVDTPFVCMFSNCVWSYYKSVVLRSKHFTFCWHTFCVMVACWGHFRPLLKQGAGVYYAGHNFACWTTWGNTRGTRQYTHETICMIYIELQNKSFGRSPLSKFSEQNGNILEPEVLLFLLSAQNIIVFPDNLADYHDNLGQCAMHTPE